MSVANRKFTDMKQIEFQQSGSSRVEAMLTQPLLEKASTYMCEITDLQATIGEELAFPENQWMFSIIRKPLYPAANMVFFLSRQELDNYMSQMTNGNFDATTSDVFGVPVADMVGFRWRGRYLLNMANNNTVEQFPATIIREDHHVISRRYYSVLDFVSDLAMQVKQIDRMIAGGNNLDAALNPAPIPWEETPEDEINYFSLTVDSGGHLIFNMAPAFMNQYFIVTSPLFQKVTGFSTFVGKHVVNNGNHRINSITDYTTAGIETLEDINLGGSNILFLLGIEPYYDIEDTTDNFGTLYSTSGDIYRTALVSNRSTTVRDIIPVQDGIDIRKKLVVEVSLPISHTLCWDGKKETTKHLLQEFILSAGTILMKYTSGEDYTDNIVELQQKQNQGQLVLLNGGSNLALKKLFEGQMQAFRIDLLLNYNRWDKGKLDFVRTTKQLDIGAGGFFYLKLLFTKETI